MKKLVVTTWLLWIGLDSQSQLYMTKNALVSFHSHTWLEDVDAVNSNAYAVIDMRKKNIAFSMMVKEFSFKKKLMQEHFNENYVESNKFPKAEFKGTITNNADIDYTKDGSYTARVKGKMTIHGVTKDVETSGTIKVDGGKLDSKATFNLLLSDYDIKIPSVVKDKISNNIKITVDCKMEPLKG